MNLDVTFIDFIIFFHEIELFNHSMDEKFTSYEEILEIYKKYFNEDRNLFDIDKEINEIQFQDIKNEAKKEMLKKKITKFITFLKVKDIKEGEQKQADDDEDFYDDQQQGFPSDDIPYLKGKDSEFLILSSHFIDIKDEPVDLGPLVDLDFFLQGGGVKQRRMFKGHELKNELESKQIQKPVQTLEQMKVEIEGRKDQDEDIDLHMNLAHINIMNSIKTIHASNNFFSDKQPIEKINLKKIIQGNEDDIKTNMEEEIFDLKIELGIFKSQGLFSVFKQLAKSNFNFAKSFERINENFHCVWLQIAGFRTPIEISQKFPVQLIDSDQDEDYTQLFSLVNFSKNSNSNANSTSNNRREKNDMLFSIPFIEKVQAKIMGRWDRVKLGTSDFLLRLISGQPQEVMFTQTLELKDLEFDKEGHVMLVAHTGCSNKNEMVLNDLINSSKNKDRENSNVNRVDSVLIVDIKRENQCLLLFDPWKNIDWQGQYKRDSPELKELQSFDWDFEKQENQFVLSWEDFREIFGVITRTQVLNNYQQNCLRLKFQNKNLIKEITIEIDDKDQIDKKIYIIINQQEPTLFDDEHEQRLTEYKMQLTKVDEGVPRLIRSGFGGKHNPAHTFQVKIKPGLQRLILIKLYPLQHYYLTVGTWWHNQNIHLTEVDSHSQHIDYFQTIRDIYINQWKYHQGKSSFPENQEIIDFKSEMVDWISGVRIVDENGIFIIQLNTHKKNLLRETIHIKQMLGYKVILNDYSESTFMDDQLEPDYNRRSDVKVIEDHQINIEIKPGQTYCQQFMKIKQEFILDIFSSQEVTSQL